MNSTLKLIQRFFMVLVLSVFLLLILNGLLVLVFSFHYSGAYDGNSGPWTAAETIAQSLTPQSEGGYQLSAQGSSLLSRGGAWAILVENGTGNVVWHSDNLPGEIPLSYTVGDLSQAVRGYIQDYPTTVSEYGEDLLILGFPKQSYWKLLYNTFSYSLIANAPWIVLAWLGMNVFLVLLIYLITTSGVVKAVKPIIGAIEALPKGESPYVKEKGLFAQLAASINGAAEKIRTQDYALRKKETARANWIAGASHDIRTPLTVVMGTAGQLEEDRSLSQDTRTKAGVIRRQSQRIQQLVNDLNLASKLEYNVQPLQQKVIHAVALLRQVAVDFLNLDAQEQYPIHWETSSALSPCLVLGDENLLKRALSNLIVNAQTHNPQGCSIFLSVTREGEYCCLWVQDDGVGLSDEELDRLQHTPHYMMCDSSTGEPRHGLGLLLVRQIAKVHQGTLLLGHSPQGGLEAKLQLPLWQQEKMPHK